MVNKPKIGREIKKPVELYHQNCVLKATVMQNRRDRLNGPQRSKAMSERKKKSRELIKKKVLEEAAKEKRNEEKRVKKEKYILKKTLALREKVKEKKRVSDAKVQVKKKN